MKYLAAVNNNWRTVKIVKLRTGSKYKQRMIHNKILVIELKCNSILWKITI